MDIWSKKKRSEVMRKIKSKNSKPELLLRSSLFKNGLRYKLHCNNLIGKPDIVFPKYKTIIFVHGCFWHQHKDCKDGRIPNSNVEFWRKKLTANILRDKKNENLLKQDGWNVIIIWECEIVNHLNETIQKLLPLIGNNKNNSYQ